MKCLEFACVAIGCLHYTASTALSLGPSDEFVFHALSVWQN